MTKVKKLCKFANHVDINDQAYEFIGSVALMGFLFITLLKTFSGLLIFHKLTRSNLDQLCYPHFWSSKNFKNRKDDKLIHSALGHTSLLQS